MYHFWDTHAAVLVGDHVIDPTAKQYDRGIKGLFYRDRQEYLYWLSGQLFMRGTFAMYHSWKQLTIAGKIRTYGRDINPNLAMHMVLQRYRNETMSALR